MTWFKVDDKFHGHPKVAELSLAAVGVWTVAGSWCADYLTDGAITPGQLRRLGGTDAEAAELVEAGLWEQTATGWTFRNWHAYQPTRESVEAKRGAESTGAARGNHMRWHAARGVVSPDCEFCTAESGSRSGTRSGQDQVPVGSTSAKDESSPNPPVPVPVPIPTDVGMSDARASASADTSHRGSGGKGRRKPAQPIPDGWTPTEAHATRAHELGVDLSLEAEKFVNHAKANDRRQVDWSRSFYTWLTNAHQFQKRDGGPRRTSAEQRIDTGRAWLSRTEGWDEQRAAADNPFMLDVPTTEDPRGIT